eukprot:CAMPEP_0204209160 /NCGR_PEP_ID=MMETSP0361-20130328/73003_1 /ASSEMBLY_ACC=CAM_ASM_000343 /TAXON_ID=268821 /ORGANISM="Scrippsiella Hangoei, Strain SHTV-5" /LENGTH=102 /DNA_ID=CAMNT_0051173063 /DNA_START=113 /DNA_END=418 /DNA_ORIENTATION=-
MTFWQMRVQFGCCAFELQMPLMSLWGVSEFQGPEFTNMPIFEKTITSQLVSLVAPRASSMSKWAGYLGRFDIASACSLFAADRADPIPNSPTFASLPRATLG